MNGGAGGVVLAWPVWVAPRVSRASVSSPHLHTLEVTAVMLAALARPACYSTPRMFTMTNDDQLRVNLFSMIGNLYTKFYSFTGYCLGDDLNYP